MEYYKMTAYELSKQLQEKKISSAELTAAVFERIEQTEEKVDAYITLNKEAALRKAAEVDKKRSENAEMSNLAGIPIGIKDNICTKDVLTTCASKMLSNFVPPYNATVMDKLEACDIVMTGKLNMDEFAMGSSTETSYFKKTKNPVDLTRVPGGSSGGSAAAVAAGEAVLALGSDTGGSIRQPSSFCGTVGLKPTYGTVSRYGLVAFASSLDQIGPIGKSVKDAAMLYSAICGHDRMDATSAYRSYPNYLDCLGKGISGLRIGIPKEYFGEGIDSEVKDSILKAAKMFEQNGACVKEISLPSTDYALSAYYIIASAEASSNLARFDGVKYGYSGNREGNLNDLYLSTRSEGFGAEVKRRIMLGTYVLSSGYYDAYYKRAKMLQRMIAQEFEDAFRKCDVIATPTTPTTAFRLGEKTSDPLEMYASDICTVTVNIAGLPGISVPCGFGAGSLPIGLQLIGPKFSEAKLLGVAKTYETARGGFAVKEL